MKVFQVGAAGNIGSHLATVLIRQGHTVTGMHRRPGQATTLSRCGVIPVLGDLATDSVECLAERIAGHDVVVFSASAHGTGMYQTSLVDGTGLEKTAQAALQTGASRFILVSVFPETGRGGDLGEDFEHFIRVKKASEAYLVKTSLDWLIVRPGLLMDTDGSGQISAGLALENAPVSRDDVVSFLAQAVRCPGLRRMIVELTNGPDPVAKAVRKLTHPQS